MRQANKEKKIDTMISELHDSTPDIDRLPLVVSASPTLFLQGSNVHAALIWQHIAWREVTELELLPDTQHGAHLPEELVGLPQVLHPANNSALG